jgi:hypothetical protein
VTVVGFGSTAALASPALAGPRNALASAFNPQVGGALQDTGASDRTLAAAVVRAMRLPSRFAPPARTAAQEPAGEPNRLNGLESPSPERVVSPAAQFARRVQREGLPLAHLWQSKSALLSIGLNAKGKPGLWLTQKIP